MASRVQPKILEGAIRLFGAYGFHGVTTRQLAQDAGVVEGSIYLCFASKDNLYREAVDAVLKRLADSLGRFLVALHAGSPGVRDRKEQLTVAVQSLYSSLSPSATRLVQQVLMADKKRYKETRNSLDSIVNVIANTLELRKKAGTQPSLHGLARMLIYGLLQARSIVSESDAEIVSREIIDGWVLSVAAIVD